MRALNVTVVILLFCFCNGIVTFPDYNHHECKRACNGTRMKCSYKFDIERMFSMEPNNCMNCLNSSVSDCMNPQCIVVDGREKLLYTVNRQIPGPTIEVCKGDVISVLATNKLVDAAMTIHWHGQHQRRTPYMDGVPMVTQCPIQPGAKFLYEFEASQEGSNIYHAHMGYQRMDGFSGGLIVRVPDEDNKIRGLYDQDLSQHLIEMTDWSIRNGMEENYNQFRNKIYGKINTAILINGFGSNRTNNIPSPIFEVEKGVRYRFRVIHTGSSSCSISLSVDQHTITLVSTDGRDIQPLEVDVLTLTAGERFDFVLNADQAEDYYWIKATGESQCANLENLALLKYTSKDAITFPAKETVPNATREIEFTSIGERETKASVMYTFTNVSSVDDLEPELAEEPDFKYSIAIQSQRVNLRDYEVLSNATMILHMLNNISSHMPHTNLLEDMGDEPFCNREHLDVCDRSKTFCECLHGIEIPYKKTVEFLYVNTMYDFLHHPIHMHGYSFRVLAHETFGRRVTLAEVEERNRRGLLKRNYDNPPIKDTLSVPPGGYSIIRFKADNPGYWFLHCHVEYHMQLGMEMVLKVGDPKRPPKNFPKCSDYTESTFDFKAVNL